MEQLKITCLGTAGWFDSKAGHTVCTLIESDDYYIIFDAGSGFYKLDQFMNQPKPTYLFLGHFHLDHIGGLHVLAKFNFEKGLFIVGQTGLKHTMDVFLNAPFTVSRQDLRYPTTLLELPDEIHHIPFHVTALPLRHAGPALGFRIELSGNVISYCADTGYCENAVTLSKNADLLITECAFKPGEENDHWPHLNPENAARIAKEASAKKLLLTHFDAKNYPTADSRKNAEKISRTIFKETIASYDDMTLYM